MDLDDASPTSSTASAAQQAAAPPNPSRPVAASSTSSSFSVSQAPPPHLDGGAPVLSVSTIKRRATIACRRCRRMRSKCLHDKARPPCKPCSEAGLTAEDCVFPSRGQPDLDRDFRHPRVKGERALKRDIAKAKSLFSEGILAAESVPQTPRLSRIATEWDLLPPVPDIISAVGGFTKHYFQLGFIQKELFPRRLEANHRSVSVLLLLGILSISARFTPAIACSYGGGIQATELFMERAQNLANLEIYEEPSLERCQGFYLLSLAQQGSGWKNRSYINMGVAVRMAVLLKLHREETYSLRNPKPDLIVTSESARRTFWMLHSQDNLHSAPNLPVSLHAADITTLLPMSEEQFAQGREPAARAALEGTPPALKSPGRIFAPDRSLFASLIQVHNLWGKIARKAVSRQSSPKPWDQGSEFHEMKRKLYEWEKNLPHDHRWSPRLLKWYKNLGQDLAYLGVTMVTRLCNIVIRKAYLYRLMRLPAGRTRNLKGFWQNLSIELFQNVCELYEQIDLQFVDRRPEESVGAQMAAFCVYGCALHLAYLVKYPRICAESAMYYGATKMMQRLMSILAEQKEVWPLASRWLEGLSLFLGERHQRSVISEGSMADGREPIPNALYPPINMAALYPPVAGRPSNRSSPDGGPSSSSGSRSPPPTLPRLKPLAPAVGVKADPATPAAGPNHSNNNNNNNNNNNTFLNSNGVGGGGSYLPNGGGGGSSPPRVYIKRRSSASSQSGLGVLVEACDYESSKTGGPAAAIESSPSASVLAAALEARAAAAAQAAVRAQVGARAAVAAHHQQHHNHHHQQYSPTYAGPAPSAVPLLLLHQQQQQQHQHQHQAAVANHHHHMHSSSPPQLVAAQAVGFPPARGAPPSYTQPHPHQPLIQDGFEAELQGFLDGMPNVVGWVATATPGASRDGADPAGLHHDHSFAPPSLFAGMVGPDDLPDAPTAATVTPQPQPQQPQMQQQQYAGANHHHHHQHHQQEQQQQQQQQYAGAQQLQYQQHGGGMYHQQPHPGQAAGGAMYGHHQQQQQQGGWVS